MNIFKSIKKIGGIVTPVSVFEERRDENGRWVSAKKVPKGTIKRWKAEYLFYDDTGKRRKIRRIAARKKDVIEAIDKVKREIEQGLVSGGANKSIEKYLTEWLEIIVKPTCTLKTYEKYKSGLECYVIPFLGKKTLKSLLPEDVRRLYNRLAKGEFRESGKPIAPTTIASVHIAFRAALTDAVEDGLIPRNVVKLASPPIVAPKKVKALDEAQIQVLLRAVKDHRLYAAVVLALGSGAPEKGRFSG